MHLEPFGLSPSRESLRTEASKMRVQGLVTDDKAIARFTVKINGETVSTRGISVKERKRRERTELKFDRELPLREGANLVSLIAVDRDGLTMRRDISVERVRITGEIWAVVIGISKYPKTRPLRYGAEDARAFYRYLTRDLGVPESHVKLLVDEQATQLGIKSALGEFLKRKAGRDDQVMIYYAGHGAVENDAQSPDGDGLSKYLLAFDSDPKSLYSTGIPMDEVARIFSRIRAERVVFFGDTCYSGASGGRTVLAHRTRATISERFLERLSRGKGRIILTASGANEVSLEDDKLGHGVFTYFLLEGLKGKADLDRDGFVTVEEVCSYVSKKVPDSTGQSQTPVKKGESEGGIVVGMKARP